MEKSKIPMRLLAKAREIAKDGGYEDATYSGRWHGYNVFSPVRSELLYTGFPSFILHRFGRWRWSSGWEESSKIMDAFPSS